MMITAVVSTKDRYFTTLPLCLVAIANQSFIPKKLLIFDDGEQRDLRNEPLYQHIFSLLTKKNIDWEVLYGERKGQVLNHYKSLKLAKTDWIWRCFRGDTIIETEYGTKPIRDIKIGDRVKTHLGRFREVIKTFKTPYLQHKPLLWIKTKYSTIKCTPEHPFLTLHSKNVVWEKANQLRSFLLYPLNKNYNNTINFNCFGNRGLIIEKVKIDTDLARFFGLYLAEGCGGHDSIRFTFNNNEKEYINFISKMSKEKFNRIPTIYKRWATTVKINIRSFNKRFIEWFGKDANNKKVPDFVFNWDIKNKIYFILGYLEGDGWERKGGGYRFATSSIELFNGIKKLMEECGISCKYYFRPPIKRTIGKHSFTNKGAHQGSILSKDYRKFLDLKEASIFNEYLAIPIVSVEKKNMPIARTNGNDQFVYNLEVEEDNSYIAHSGIVHNCDDDNIPESNVLEELVSHIEDNVGAVGGLVLDPKNLRELSNKDSSKIENVLNDLNIQLFKHKENTIKEVDHLYSTFIYRKDLADYPLDLSIVGHREETIMSYRIKRKGYKLLVTPKAITWHFRYSQGGIRDNNIQSYFGHDEEIFKNKLKEWNIKTVEKTVFILDNGLGDHIIFKKLLPEIRQKYKNITLSVCYPEIFVNDKDIELISIQEAKNIYGNLDKWNLYKWMRDNQWNDNIENAFRKLYSI